MVDYKKLGQRIRESRIKAYLTQEQLAEAVGLSAVYIGQIERAERKLSIETLVSIANKLQVSVDGLLIYSDETGFGGRINELISILKDRSDKEISFIIDTVKTLLKGIENDRLK